MFPRISGAILFVVLSVTAAAQPPPPLTLQQAEEMAIKNHPQIQAAQNEVNFANQQVVINRSAYYPDVSGDITGSQGNNLARIGAGDLPASRLFDREAQGVIVHQLITDSGRTHNLVASARFQAQAASQNSQATRYTVLLDVNRAYFDVLHAQAAVKVAEQTVAARQLLDNQVTELARNKLRSQVDVSFADVNVSQAKLLLLRAQDSVTGALAELGRAMGSDQPAGYQLSDEPLPTAPAATADSLISQAIDNRPELASPATAPIPPEYEGVGANVSIPIFNGHLFSARREAAYQRALEADQRLRDEQERISRDVRVAWASATDAYQRIDVTAQFLSQASLAMQLAQGRYDLSLASIVELTQAQLNVTTAEIENLNAKYDYQTQYAALQFTLGLLR
jgi:outer membrane protein